MSQIVHCPECQRQLRVPEEFIGMPVKCPTCFATFTAAGSGGAPAEERLPRQEMVMPPPGERRREAFQFEQPEFPNAYLAREQVQGPATGLLVSGYLTILLGFFSIGWYVFVGIMSFQENAAKGKPFEVGELVGMGLGLGFGVVQGIAGVVTGLLINKGARKMKQLESHGWALTSAILSVTPFTTCCIVSLPIGIWSLVVLCKPEVKEAFEK